MPLLQTQARVRTAHLEHRLFKRVTQDAQAARLLNARLHFKQANLIQRAREHINYMRVCRNAQQVTA